MKRLLSFVLVLTMLATMFVGVTAVSANETETATIKLVGATVNDAGQFDVAVKLQNNTDLLAGQIGLKFDTAKLTAVSVTASDYIAAIGNDSNIVDGEVLVMFDATAAVSFAEVKDVATIKFQVAEGVDYSTVAFTLDEDFTKFATAPDYAVVAEALDASEFVLADEVCLHTETREEVVTEASCTAEGSKNVICTKCNEVVDTIVLPKLDHTESEWIVDKQPTTDDLGSQHKECTVCGETIVTEDIPLLPEEGLVAKGYGEYGPGVLHKFYEDGRLELIGKEPGAYTYDFTAKDPNPIKDINKNEQVKSVTITGIEKLGTRACYNFGYATSVTIDGTIKEISPWTFSYCDNIRNLTIEGKNITRFSTGTFHKTRKIRNLIMEDYTKAEYDAIVVGENNNAWHNTYTIVVSDGKYGVIRGDDVQAEVPEILFNWEVHDGVMNVEGEGVIPNYKMNAGEEASPWFEYKAEITELNLSDGITHIGEYTFNAFDSLTSLELPYTLETMGMRAFYSVANVSELTMYNTFKEFKSNYAMDFVRGATLNFNGTEEEFNAIGRSGTVSAVSRANKVYSAVEQSGETGEVAWSFDNHGVLRITGEGAMADYASAADAPWAGYAIEEVFIGNDVTTVGANAFAGLANLERIVLGNNTHYINDGAFANVGVKTVIAYDRLFEVREGAFAGAEIGKVLYQGTEDVFDAIAIYKNNDGIKDTRIAYVGNNVAREVLAEGTCGGEGSDFVNTYKLYDDGVLVISGKNKIPTYKSSALSPFAKNNDIKVVMIAKGIQNIGERTFDENNSLTAVYTASTVKSLDGTSYASFRHIPNLTTLYLGGCTKIGSTAFSSQTASISKIIYNGADKTAISGYNVSGLGNATWVYCK